MIRKLILILFVTISLGLKAQVNLNTGSATFNLPMFNWTDDNSRLNAAVALSYHSGNGLKVNDLPSNVGQGWNLMAGGSVTRMQVGEPDDQKAFHAGAQESNDDITKYPAGYLYNSANIADGCPTALTSYPIYTQPNQLYKQRNVVTADREADYFAFTFNGRSGIFILSRNGQDIGVVLGDCRLKVSFIRDESLINLGIRTVIRGFTIQDENGLIYKFGDIYNTEAGKFALGRTKILRTGFCDASFQNRLYQPKFKNQKVYFESSFEDNSIPNPWVINSWHLIEIEDALTHRKIDLNYGAPNSISSRAGIDITNYYSDKRYIILSNKTSISKAPKINSISFPDGHLVSFNYGSYRVDLTGERILSSVDIKYQNRYLSRYQLNTGYFILNRLGIPTSDYQKRVARLCLLSVQKYGVDLKLPDNPYRFDYYLGSNADDDFVPPPFYHMKDIWGYFDGDNNQSYDGWGISLTKDIVSLSYKELLGLCFLRDVIPGVQLTSKPGYAKNGLLKQIIYPTGGSLMYEYEQNSGILAGESRYLGGVHVSKTKLTDGGYTHTCDNPLVTNYEYTEADGSSSLWGVEMPKNSLYSESYYRPLNKKFKGTKCDYVYKYPGIITREQAVNLTELQQMLVVFGDVMNVISTISTVIDIINVISGVTGPGSLIVTLITTVVDIAITCFGDHSKTSSTTVYFNNNLNDLNPLPIQFKRVVVYQNSGGAGKTIHEFTSSDDYGIWQQENQLYSMKQRFAMWAYGLPKRIAELDASGNLVKETLHVYDNSMAKYRVGIKSSMAGGDPSCKCVVFKNSSMRNLDWETQPVSYIDQSSTDLKVEFYNYYSGRVQLVDSYERMYKVGTSEYLETRTSYEYSYTNYKVNKVITFQSDGKKYFKQLKYAGDYVGSGTVLGTLYNNNIIEEPVETVTGYFDPNSNSTYYLSQEDVDYTMLGNGDIRPGKILKAYANQPSLVALGNYSPGSYSPSLKEVKSFVYNTTGNLIGIKDDGYRSVTKIYDYNNKFVTATVVNADAVLDKPAYSSFETGSLGGWQIQSGTSSYATGTAVTGERSLALNGSLTAQVNSSKPYRLSLWANSSNVQVNGAAVLVKSAPTINGYTYYEYEIPQGNSSISVTANTTIDELRLYPMTARMTTTCYDPFYGKTTDCDENNRITFYEYDNLARLRFIKDEKKHIVKMYEYNYGDKRGGCPTIYYNNQISEVFIKNDCGTGYIGSEVVYTIPANTYSSTVSQWDADIQAQDQLDEYGQLYANTHGTCIPVYYNVELTASFTKSNCPPGYKGTDVDYTVPAGRYMSTVGQAEADEMAQDDIDANGQYYADNNGTCINDTDPDWQADDPAQTRCQQNTGGEYTGHREVYMTDMNPSSATYGQSQWIDLGFDQTCPVSSCYYYRIQVPNDVATNLYVHYTLCNGQTFVAAWSQLPHDDDVSPPGWGSSWRMCLRYAPTFRYGPYGNDLLIPEIIITQQEACN